jgi:PKD repeat protein
MPPLRLFTGTPRFHRGTEMPSAKVVVVFALLIPLVSFGWPAVHGQTSNPNFSTIYFSPTTTCCGTGGNPYQQNGIFNVSVNLNLLAGESINAFDVIINYTNPHEILVNGTDIRGVLQPTNIFYFNNIFNDTTLTHGETASVLTKCIDGQSVGNFPAAGCSGENPGQLHLAEVLYGSIPITGPVNGQLFTIGFKVLGPGYSVFTPAQTQLVTPATFSFIPVVRQTGVFANEGVVAFFTYQSDYVHDTLLSPSLLSNQQIIFNATYCFVANETSLGFKSYSWSFGDGSSSMNTTSPVETYTYKSRGNFTVSLTATDDKNEQGKLSQTISVMPGLGALSLTVDDSSGSPQDANVQVSIYNSSSSGSPFATQTINQAGGVIFANLLPGSYYLTFSGQGFVSSSKNLMVLAGFTLTETIYLTPAPSPVNYSGLIYLGTILGGLAAVAGVFFFERRRSRSSSKKSPTKAKGLKNQPRAGVSKTSLTG